MSLTPLTESNFLLYAAHFYDNAFPDTSEFQEDLKRIIYIKRLFNLYHEKGELRERLILNHLVILFNMFGEHLPPMLFLKLQGYETTLKTFLSYLNRMPNYVGGIGEQNVIVNNNDIPLDPNIWQKLALL